MNPQALGRYLRESREASELRLEDAVRRLRIRQHILESFEQGDFDVADTPVRVRGMLRNYARFLGLDEDQVLGFYEASQQESTQQRGGWFGLGRSDDTPQNPIAPKRVTDTPPALPKVETPQSQKNASGGTMQRLNTLLRNMAMLLVSVAALAVIGFVIMQTVNPPQPAQPIAQQPEPTFSGSETVTPTLIFTSTPAPTQLTAELSFSDFSGVSVGITMEGRSWMRVWVDETETFVGILEPGDMQDFNGDNRVRLIAANAAALQITYNGEPQAALGARGQQVEVTFETNNISVDVQSAGEQPTFTPPPTATASETLMPGFPTFTPPPTATPLAMPPTDSPVDVQPSPTWTPDAPQTAPDTGGDPDIGNSAAVVNQPAEPTPTPLPLGNNPVQPQPALTATPDTGSQGDGLPPAPVNPANPVVTATTAASATPSTTTTATLTLTPAGTPTPTAILPIRATPADRPPTKQP